MSLFSIFPKSLALLSCQDLAAFLKKAGLTACNAVVRDGFWTPPNDLERTLPTFMAIMNEAGIEVPMAETDWDPHAALASDEFPRHLDVMHCVGIRRIRLRQINSGGKFGAVGNVVAELDAAKMAFARLARIAEQRAMQFLYQTHFKTLLASPSSLYPLVNGLNPERFSVMLDAGNQLMEGWENWLRSCRLFGSQIAAFGVKDVSFEKAESVSGDPSKGWTAQFVPCDEGLTNWQDVGNALRDIAFDGIYVMMPFYPESRDPDRLLPTLRSELAYVRKYLP